MAAKLDAWTSKPMLASVSYDARSRSTLAYNTIAQKYKEYNKFRNVLAGKPEPQTPSKAPRKRKTMDDNVRTPSKPLFKPVTTPAKHEQVENTTLVSTPGSASNLFTPVHVRSKIGPTPQKDGLVLGIFDLLQSETPSRAQRTVLGDVGPNVMQTPSKNHGGSEDTLSVEEWARGSRTPLSAGKRFLLDKFATPKKRKRDEEGTPSSTMKHFSTPMFLRRDTRPLDIIDEEDEPTPRPAPWKRRGLGRSLSSMIQTLKKQEEERAQEARLEEEEAMRQEEDRLDDELEMMREMEMEAAGISVPRPKPAPKLLVEDSQGPMKLGPDTLEESDQDETQQSLGALDRNGNPRKAWKKRGQKRTTRRVNSKFFIAE
jgi:26S proteasome regulatory subunit N12